MMDRQPVNSDATTITINLSDAHAVGPGMLTVAPTPNVAFSYRMDMMFSRPPPSWPYTGRPVSEYGTISTWDAKTSSGKSSGLFGMTESQRREYAADLDLLHKRILANIGRAFWGKLGKTVISERY